MRDLVGRLVERLLRLRPGLLPGLVALAGAAGHRDRAVAALAPRVGRWRDPSLVRVALSVADARSREPGERWYLAQAIGTGLRLDPPVVAPDLLRDAEHLPLSPAMRSSTARLARAGDWTTLALLAGIGDAALCRRIALQAAADGRFDVAVVAATEFEGPERALLWLSLAQRAVDAGQFEIAVDLADRGGAGDGTLSPALELWVTAQTALGEPEAIADRVRHVATVADDERTTRWVVQRLLSARWLDEAAQLARRLPDDSDGPVLEVRARLLARRYTEADELISRLTDCAGGEALVAALGAELFERRKQLDDALGDYVRAIELDPSHPRADTWRLSASRIAIDLGSPTAGALVADLRRRRPDDVRIPRLEARIAARRCEVPDRIDDSRTRFQVVRGLAEAGDLEQLQRVLEGWT